MSHGDLIEEPHVCLHAFVALPPRLSPPCKQLHFAPRHAADSTLTATTVAVTMDVVSAGDGGTVARITIGSIAP